GYQKGRNAMSVNAVPDGYHSVTPYITVDDGNAAVEFYKKAFGATEILRIPMGDKLAHAEIRIGDSVVMLSDEFPEMDKLSPKTRGGSTAGLMIYLPDVDIAFERALAAGGAPERAVANQFYGDRSGTIRDPFGHSWTLSTHLEDVSAEEMNRRMSAYSGGETEPA
ncbi:MAG: VOC family protein, partial [Allosphingosinicella sp.]